MLGSHSQVVHVGEISRLRKTDSPKLARACHLCGDKESCRLLRGITPENIESIYDLIFDNVQDPGIRAIVDNSKKPEWAARFVKRNDYAKRYIHLIRDPRALVRRWLLTYGSPKKRWEQRWRAWRAFPIRGWRCMLMPYTRVLAYKWLAQNLEITRFIEAHRLDGTIVTYRDLACQPAVELERLTRSIGLKYEPGQEAYWNFEHHGTQKGEYEWVKTSQVGHFDLRWQQELPVADQNAIRNNPYLSRYVERQGLLWGDDGLRRAEHGREWEQ